MTDKAIAIIRPSPVRRLVALAATVGCGLVLIYFAFTAKDVAFLWKSVSVVIGVLLVFMADWLRRSTRVSIELSRSGIRDTEGRMLCALDNIEAVERSAFSLKPSNGLGVKLKTPESAAWVPGLWWRYGRRLGIGGITPAAEAKFMGDLIALHLKGHEIGFDAKLGEPR